MEDIRFELEPGMSGGVSAVVSEAMTAIAMGSGDVPVLATPAVLALIEAACVDAIAGALPEDLTSVGVHVSLDHVAPSSVGATVEATATLEGVDGRKLMFTCIAKDGDTVVARATHRRVIVARDRFGA